MKPRLQEQPARGLFPLHDLLCYLPEVPSGWLAFSLLLSTISDEAWSLSPEWVPSVGFEPVELGDATHNTTTH